MKSLFPNNQGQPSVFPKRPPKGSFEAGSFLTIALISVINSNEALSNPQLITVVLLCIIAAIITLRR